MLSVQKNELYEVHKSIEGVFMSPSLEPLKIGVNNVKILPEGHRTAEEIELEFTVEVPAGISG